MKTITGSTSVAEILKLCPSARPIFDRHGLHGCGGGNGPAESLEFFASVHEADLDALLREHQLDEVAEGAGQADGERVGAAAHGVDVGEVRGGGLAADVAGRGPFATEVTALDPQVGGDDHVALGSAQDGGGVTGAHVPVAPVLGPAHEGLGQAEPPHRGPPPQPKPRR